VAVPEAKVLHPYWSNPLKQVRGWAEGDVLCLEALPHMTFYAFPNWAERLLLIFAYGLTRSVQSLIEVNSDGAATLRSACDEVLAAWAWAAKVSLAVVAVEVAMRMAVHYPNAVRKACVPSSAKPLCECDEGQEGALSVGFGGDGDSAVSEVCGKAKAGEGERAGGKERQGGGTWMAICKHAYFMAVSGLAVLPEVCQDATRLLSKLRRLKLNQVCMCLDWMDGQHEHVTAVRVERFIKNAACLAVLGALESRVPHLLRGALVLTLLPVGLLWVLQNNNRAVVGGRPRRCNLLYDPLPLGVGSRPLPEACAHGPAVCEPLAGCEPLPVSCQSFQSRSSACMPTAHTGDEPTERTRQLISTSATAAIPWNSPVALPCRPFVVLTHQRAGSNLLCGFLHHHHEIAMHNELFHDQTIHTYGWKNHTWTPKQRDATPVDFLADVLSGSGCYKKSGRAPKAVGFKLLPEHWHRSDAMHSAFERFMLDPRVLKVVLRRENRLKTCVSAMRVGIRGAYMSEQYDDLRVHIRPQEFQEFCDNYDACFAYYSRMLQGQTFHTVTYEDLAGASSQEECLHGLLGFLGLDTKVALKTNPACTRQSTGDMRRAVVNYPELEYACRHSMYAKDFEESPATTASRV
jgi:LPS sulfotransferase NodH